MLSNSLPNLLCILFTIIAVGALFYYIKQRFAVIEHSQMEQAKVLQSFIASMHQKNMSMMAQSHQMQQQYETNEKHESLFCTRDKCFPNNEGKIDVSDEEEDEEEDNDTDSENDSDNESDSGSEVSESSVEDNENKIKEIHLTSNVDELHHDSNISDPNIKVIEIKNNSLESEDDTKSETSECSTDSEDSSESHEIQEIQEIHLDENNEKDIKNFHIDSNEGEESKYKNMSVAALRNLVKSKNNKDVSMSDSAINKLTKKELIKLLI